MHVQAMISAHPGAHGSTDDVLVRCIEQCLDCAEACTACADACLAEEMVAELRRCIRLDLDCADICEVTARVAGRRTGGDANVLRLTLETCAAICRVCGEECDHHAGRHEHCRICAEACHACERACRAAMGGLPQLQ